MMTRLLDIMATLRDPQRGCEWDLAQTPETIVPHTIEEAYEVADAVEQNDSEALRDELGDLLFQVVFQSRIAEEAGTFDFADVVTAVSDKLEARHPHIFGSESLPGGMQEANWESLKERERAAKGETSAMDGVATALPALLRAEKLQKRAERDGFDWGDTTGPSAKLREEIQELAEASIEQREEEAGDLLFAAVNVVRAYGIAPETALRRGNAKFERRYRKMEAFADGKFSALSLEEQEALWQRAKASETTAKA